MDYGRRGGRPWNLHLPRLTTGLWWSTVIFWSRWLVYRRLCDRLRVAAVDRDQSCDQMCVCLGVCVHVFPDEMVSYFNMQSSTLLEWFFMKLLALVLSHYIGSFPNYKPKSCKICFIHRIWVQKHPTAMYTDFDVDKATRFCFLLN